MDVGWSRVPQGVRNASWLRDMLLAFLLVFSLQPRAWDADRLLAAGQKLGPPAHAGARQLQAMLIAVAPFDDEAKLVAVNQFFNLRVQFREDLDLWGRADYWASPLEMLGKGQGDCEDLAIAKYFSLLASGVPTAKLRLVYVRALIGGAGGMAQPHMVLAYYVAPGADALILDNLIPSVQPATMRHDLTPVFSFNSEGLWHGVAGQAAGDPTARLSRWREVLAKVRAEGWL